MNTILRPQKSFIHPLATVLLCLAIEVQKNKFTPNTPLAPLKRGIKPRIFIGLFPS
jgi:hypothetical protein